MTNESMPGIYKVGMTRREPVARLAEANGSDTWRPPTDYVLEYAVRVSDVLETERKLHALLAESGVRIHPRREFFKAPMRTIKILMDRVSAAVADDDDVVVIDTADDDDEPYYHPSVMPKKAREPAGAATRMHLRSGRLVK